MSLLTCRRRGVGNPSLYDAEIAYLESTGVGEYINTHISPSSDIILVVDGLFPVIEGNNLISGTIALSNNNVYKRFHFGINQLHFVVGVGTATGGTKDADTNRYTFQMSGKDSSFYMDGFSFTGDSKLPNIPIYLFCRNFDGVASNFHRFRLYSAYIYSYSNNSRILDLIPVRKGQVGYMYDKVSGQLFGNGGTGSFILGPDK